MQKIKKRVKEIIIGIVLILLLLIIVGVLFVAAFTLQKPGTVISFLENLKPIPTHAPIRIKGIAVLGDSQSDEYRADDQRGGIYADTTLNWVELLATHRKLPFGQWGEFEEPRRGGYEYNWARSGATAYSMLVSGQHTGVVEQIKKGEVNVVVIFIGVNDFAPYITQDGYQSIYDGSLSDADATQKVNGLVADIKTAVDVVDAAGNAHIILVKIPDWGNHLGVQVAFPFPEKRFRVSQAVQNANDQLDDVAKEKNIPIIDPNEFFKSISRNNTGVNVQLGELTLQRLLLTDDPKNMFLSDGVHLGTVMNGLFANYMIENFNTHLGTHIKPFSTKEILTNAGIF
jgi:lysophospholipase L1-like esterase